jgi:hypothetical protein
MVVVMVWCGGISGGTYGKGSDGGGSYGDHDGGSSSGRG